MKAIGLDLETTGLLHPDHRIIEFYGALYDLDSDLPVGTRRKIEELHLRIDPQRSIAADAQRVHGISARDLIGCPIWKDVAERIADFLGKGECLVGHNIITFDKPFLDQEFKRVGVTPVDRPLFDTMEHARWATYNGKSPTLQELCFACGVLYDPTAAHKADYDVDVMMEAFFRARGWGYFQDLKEAA